jgi:hypothetical protein
MLYGLRGMLHHGSMSPDIMADEGPWRPSSACLPLIRAGVRLYAARQAIPAITAAARQLITTARAGAQTSIALAREDTQRYRPDGTTQDGLPAEIESVSGELPFMLMGQIPVYLFDVLETALSDCLAVAAATVGVLAPEVVKGPRIEGYLKALSDACDVQVRWSAETWQDLHVWRRRRNSVVRGQDSSLEAISSSEFKFESYWGAGEIPNDLALEQLVRVMETAIRGVDEAMYDICGRSTDNVRPQAGT